MVVLLKSLKPTWFNLLSNYYASDCSTFILVIHLFSDLLAVLNIPHIHEMRFRVGLFSLIFLGTQSALSICKIMSFRYGKFPRFFSLMIFSLLFFWNSIYLNIGTSVSTYVVFPIFYIFVNLLNFLEMSSTVSFSPYIEI